jgi:selenocysteine lyase/cysteine desulfurase
LLQEDVIPELVSSVAAVARFVGAHPEDCVPAANATAGLTTLLRSLPLSATSSILIMSTAYSSITTAAGRAAAAAGSGIIELRVDQSMLRDAALMFARLQDALCAAHGTVKVVVLDHILSFPPVVLPVSELAATCREVCVCEAPSVPLFCGTVSLEDLLSVIR